MPRKKTTTKPEDKTKRLDTMALYKAAQATGELTQRLITIDKKYGDGIPYDQARIIDQVRFYLNHSAEAMLQVGRHLILLKEHEPHGNFTKSLEDIGLAPQTARKMMQAAVKFSDPKRAALAVLGKTKMIELMMEDDEDLDELADGGTLADLDMDEVKKMSTRELREALRKSRQTHEADNTANEKLLESKDKKINALSKKAHSVDEQTKEFIMQAAGISSEAINLLNQMNLIRESYLAHDFGGASEDEMADIREEADNLMGPVFHHLVRQIASSAAGLITETDFVFMKHKDQEMPDLDMWEEQLDS